jgi:hypothetical protein
VLPPLLSDPHTRRRRYRIHAFAPRCVHHALPKHALQTSGHGPDAEQNETQSDDISECRQRYDARVLEAASPERIPSEPATMTSDLCAADINLKILINAIALAFQHEPAKRDAVLQLVADIRSDLKLRPFASPHIAPLQEQARAALPF